MKPWDTSTPVTNPVHAVTELVNHLSRRVPEHSVINQ